MDVVPTDLWREVAATGRAAGLDAVGVAPADAFVTTRQHLDERKAAGLHGGMHFTYGDPARSTDPSRALAGARCLVVGARSYRRSDPSRPPGTMARVARYSWRDHYEPLRAALGEVAGVLEAANFRTRVVVDDNALVDREAAYRAGLGWYGKNTNMLLPDAGSWFVLGSVVTDAELPVAQSPVAEGCGTCSRCLPACPTGALVAPGVLDARRCLAWLLEAPGDFPEEYRESLGDRIYGCDDCQEACPPNRVVDRRDLTPADGDDEAWIDVVALLRATDDELLSRFGRWYIPRRQPRYLRRNALVVLGNVGDGDAAEVEDALRSALASTDAMLRRHAVWAAEQLSRHDLIQAGG